MHLIRSFTGHDVQKQEYPKTGRHTTKSSYNNMFYRRGRNKKSLYKKQKTCTNTHMMSMRLYMYPISFVIFQYIYDLEIKKKQPKKKRRNNNYNIVILVQHTHTHNHNQKWWLLLLLVIVEILNEGLRHSSLFCWNSYSFILVSNVT